MDADRVALLPCPFCGTFALEGEDWLQINAVAGPLFNIECFGCGVEGRHFPTLEEAVAAWNRREQPAQSSLAPDSSLPKVGIFDETSKWFLIPGRNGAKGLYVAINPEGAVGIRPVDEAVGEGWGLYPEAAADLRSILDVACPLGAVPAELAVDVNLLLDEGWFALAGDFETAATEGDAAQAGED